MKTEEQIARDLSNKFEEELLARITRTMALAAVMSEDGAFFTGFNLSAALLMAGRLTIRTALDDILTDKEMDTLVLILSKGGDINFGQAMKKAGVSFEEFERRMAATSRDVQFPR